MSVVWHRPASSASAAGRDCLGLHLGLCKSRRPGVPPDIFNRHRLPPGAHQRQTRTFSPGARL